MIAPALSSSGDRLTNEQITGGKLGGNMGENELKTVAKQIGSVCMAIAHA